MFRIRTAEEAIIKYYPEDDMKTPMHMSIGEEGIVAGVCEALDDRDYQYNQSLNRCTRNLKPPI